MSRPSTHRSTSCPERRAVAALASAFTLVVLGACGSDATGPAETDGGSSVEVVTVLEVAGDDPAQVERVVELVEQRLDALGLDDVAVEVDGRDVAVTSSPADDELLAIALRTGRLEFRPVLESGEQVESLSDPASITPDAQVVLADDAGTMRYRLGPSVTGPTPLEGAEAVDQAGNWTIELVMREGAEGIDAFNRLAAECSAGAPAVCPSQLGEGPGQVAIVVDGVVWSAPAVNAAEFERDQISISGGFDESGARGLATALAFAGSDVTWTIRE